MSANVPEGEFTGQRRRQYERGAFDVLTFEQNQARSSEESCEETTNQNTRDGVRKTSSQVEQGIDEEVRKVRTRAADAFRDMRSPERSEHDTKQV